MEKVEAEEDEKYEYFCRLILLVYDLGTEMLRKLFKKEIPQGLTVEDLLKSNAKVLDGLEKRKVLNKHQIKILSETPPDVSSFDISLLYILISNLTNIQPLTGELLTEFKQVRNEAIAHWPKGTMKKSVFEWFWKRTEDTLVALADKISETEKRDVERKIADILIGKLHEDIDLLKQKAEHGLHIQDKIESIERQFFERLDRKLSLGNGQIDQLKTFLKRSSDDNKDQFEKCHNLQDILITMKAVSLIFSGSYRCITAILTEAGIDASPITLLIEQLSDAYIAIINGSEPRRFEADPFDYDAVIIHCEEDRDMVEAFIKDSKDTLNIPDLSLCLFEEFNISEPKLLSIVNVLLSSRYIYVFVTPNLTTDKFTRHMIGMALTDSLLVEQKNWRIIPIWATESFAYIPELFPFPGLKYWRFFDKIHKDDFLKCYSNLILRGRKLINRARD